jgi:hypothetical protein
VGFVSDKVYRLHFEDPDYAGLEVVVGSASMRKFLDLTKAADDDNETQVRKTFEIFGPLIRSWNLETEDGQPVPVSIDALWDLDASLVTSMIASWAESVGGVSGPLARRSPDIKPSVVPSIPMEPLSASQAS